jgi:hypothetical protein
MESSPTMSSSVAARFNDLCLQDVYEAILRHMERLSKNGDDDTPWAAFRNSARPLSLDVFFRRQERSEQRDDDGDEDSSVICTAGSTTDDSTSATRQVGRYACQEAVPTSMTPQAGGTKALAIGFGEVLV